MLKTSGSLVTGAAALAMLLPHTANAQQPRQAPSTLTCSATILHFSDRGFALECVNRQGTGSDIVVVRDGPFDGRTAMVVEILKEHNSRTTAAGRTRGTQGLWISHGPAGQQEQAVCGRVTPRYSGGRCLAAIDIAYR